jgi:membrane protease YdiL (CAAX protease family)
MLDFLLASLLLFGMPIYAVLRSYSTPHAPIDRRKRYRKSTAIVAIFLMILCIDWLSSSRGFTQLGLAPPTTYSAIAGLVAMCVVIALFLALIRKSNVQRAAQGDDEADAILPESRDDLRPFVIFVIVVGFGWEVLYRGFLLFWLSPIIGLVPAVAASSISYGLSHGCNTITRTMGSLASALLFTTGYAATRSLWWLIILHIALPLVTTLPAWRIDRAVASDQID